MEKITSLDALIQTVHDEKAKELITEAVNAYYAGAFRAAVVATWIAVFFDLVSKLRILKRDNDAEAIAILNQVDHAIQHNNIPAMLTIEESLLSKAKNNLQIISEQDFDLLQRIRADRHRCAHPAFSTNEELFQPPAEAVKAHIIYAIELLLSTTPVRGKNIITVFEKEFLGGIFPKSDDDLETLIVAKYINKTKITVTKNIIRWVSKSLFDDDGRFQKKIIDIHRLMKIFKTKALRPYDEAFEGFGLYIQTLPHEKLWPLLILDTADSHFINRISREDKIRLEGVIENAQCRDFEKWHICPLLEYSTYKERLLLKISGMTAKSKSILMQGHDFEPYPIFKDMLLDSFCESHDWNSTKALVSVVLMYIDLFSQAEMERILIAIRENDQVYPIDDVKYIVFQIRERVLAGKLDSAIWEAFDSELHLPHLRLRYGLDS